MITGISIENFKGIRERVEIELRPLTLLFGPNSAGKSSILQALQYAAEIFERRNLDAGALGDGAGDLGGFQNFVHGHNLNLDVSLGFKLSLPLLKAFPSFPYRTPRDMDEPSTLYGLCESAYVELKIGWSRFLSAPFVRRYEVSINDVGLASIQFEPGSRDCELILNSLHPIFVVDADHSSLDKWHFIDSDQLGGSSVLDELLGLAVNVGIIRRRYPNSNFPLDEHSYGVLGHADALPDFDQGVKLDGKAEDPRNIVDDPEELAEYLNSAISETVLGPGRILRDCLAKSRFLGPIREVPPRNFAPSSQQERARWSCGLGAWDRLETADSRLIDSVSHWLGDADCLNSGYRLRVKRFKEVDLSDPLVVQLLTGRAFDEAEPGSKLDLNSLPTHSRVLIVPVNGSIELRPHDVGIGISQVVPVLVTALDGSKKLLAIEQPELHVHPRLQAELADLFLEASKIQRNRFLIETHSEHCLLRLQRRIRETTKGTVPPGRSLASEDVVVYHVCNDGNGARVRQIEVDKNGEFIQPWPDDFFELDFHERFGS